MCSAALFGYYAIFKIRLHRLLVDTMAKTRKIALKRRKHEQECRKCKIFIIFLMWQMQQVHREVWVHPLNEECTEKGEFYTHYTDHRKFDNRFFELYRRSMTVAQFDELLYRVKLNNIEARN